MNGTWTTKLLAAVVVTSAFAFALAAGRLGRAARAAADAGEAFSRASAQLAELSRGGGSVAAPATRADPAGIDRQLRDAAGVAGVADRLVSVEPGEANHVAGTGRQELPVFLRVEPVALRDLVTFLHELTRADSSCRAAAIELSTPPQPAADELWVADVTLAYTRAAPAPAPAPPGQSQ